MGDVFSNTVCIDNRIPQGSVISPVLFKVI